MFIYSYPSTIYTFESCIFKQLQCSIYIVDKNSIGACEIILVYIKGIHFQTFPIDPFEVIAFNLLLTFWYYFIASFLLFLAFTSAKGPQLLLSQYLKSYNCIWSNTKRNTNVQNSFKEWAMRLRATTLLSQSWYNFMESYILLSQYWTKNHFEN